MLICKNLNHTYQGNPPIQFPDWNVEKGDHALILGPSGCGKTSLLHLLSGLLHPSKESVFIDGHDIGAMSQSKLDVFRGSRVGFVFQKPNLINSLSVKENILLSAQLAKKKISSSDLIEVMQSLGIEELAGKKAFQISQGQAQRVAIARAVIHKPQLVFGDEPTASLDDASCQSVIHLLKSQAEQSGATLIIATHDQRVKDEFANQLTL